MTAIDTAVEAFSRHARIAFQFSGGRDSTAALHVLRLLWDKMTIYTLNTGDAWPETLRVTDAMEQLVGRGVHGHPKRRAGLLAGRGASIRRGADRAHAHGLLVNGGAPISDRFACCAANIMRRCTSAWRPMASP